MSTPVGQSREQPLHDRQRSRASCTSGERQSRHRPAGREHLLQHPGPAAGGVLLLPGGRPGRAHDRRRGAGRRGTCRRRCSGARRRRSRRRRAGRPAPGPRGRCGAAAMRTSSSSLAGRTRTPGVEHVVGVEHRLDPLEEAERGGGVHERQQLAAGPAVAVLAGHRAAVARDQAGGVLDEGPVTRAGHGPARTRTGSRSARARSRRRSARRGRPAARAASSSASKSRR